MLMRLALQLVEDLSLAKHQYPPTLAVDPISPSHPPRRCSHLPSPLPSPALTEFIQSEASLGSRMGR